MTALFGAGAVGLRALATGLPVSLLMRPDEALADYKPPTCFNKDAAQYLILNTSGSGDPLNGNVPGTYDDPGIKHPMDPTMAPTPMTVGGKQYTAAAPWATMPADILARTCFFHHATMTNAHPNQPKVMELMGAIKAQEMLVSVLSSHLAPCLGTIQAEPVTIGATGPSEALSFRGRTLPILSPTGLKALLTQPAGPLANLQKMRDDDLNRINAIFKRDGTTAQKQFLDRYATSQTQVRAINQNLLGALTAIKQNDVSAQITAAVALFQMNVTPVVAMHIPFGGDNHSDPGLATEATQTVAGVASIVELLNALKSAGLQDKVTFASMNVFGRTMSLANKGQDGRDHLANHHCTLMIGKAIKSSVIGGVQKMANDYGAMALDSASGKGMATGGDVKFEETLGSVGKTLGKAVGLDPAVLDDQITIGKVIPAALA